MEPEMHFVDYATWCPSCKYEKQPDSEDPCNDCLSDPVNVESRKPVCWEANDETSNVLKKG